MDFAHREKQPGKHVTGIAVVVVLHVLVAYAIVSGLGKRMVNKVLQPVETQIIEEVRPPPPKDLPPPPPPPPEAKAPPPAFVPPAEVNVAAPPTPSVMANTSAEKPASSELSKSVAAAPAPAPAPAPDKALHVKAVVDFSACEKPEYPAASQRNEETGVSSIQFLIGVDGRVKDSKILKGSGFRELDKAAASGLAKCKFKPGTTDGKPEESWTRVDYVWSLD